MLAISIKFFTNISNQRICYTIKCIHYQTYHSSLGYIDLFYETFTHVEFRKKFNDVRWLWRNKQWYKRKRLLLILNRYVLSLTREVQTHKPNTCYKTGSFRIFYSKTILMNVIKCLMQNSFYWHNQTRRKSILWKTF